MKHSSWSRFADNLFILVGILFLTGVVQAEPYLNKDCIECHSRENGSSPLKIDVATYQTSVHASKFSCSGCHQKVVSEAHTRKPGSGRVDCLDCHQKKNRHGGSVEGFSKPQCVDCHTRHHIYHKTDPASTVHPLRIVQTCQRCHPEESGKTTYLSWLPSLRIESHNKQEMGADYSPDNCLGCHQGQGAHGEVTKISQKRCADCHMDEDGGSRLLGYMHTRADPDKQPGVYAVGFVYQFSLIFLVWGGLRRLFRKK